jgi:hypothetical protein
VPFLVVGARISSLSRSTSDAHEHPKAAVLEGQRPAFEGEELILVEVHTADLFLKPADAECGAFEAPGAEAFELGSAVE